MKLYKVYQKALPLWISTKFFLHSKQSKYIKIITITTVVGLILGVASLFTVLSVMNGFTYNTKNKITNLLPHISINTQNDYNDAEIKEITVQQEERKIETLSTIIKNTLGRDKIKEIYPSLQLQAFITNNQSLIPVIINALPKEVLKEKLANLAITKQFDNANNLITNGIILSSHVLNNLSNNSSVNFIIHDQTIKYYASTVVNKFDASDPLFSNVAFMDLEYAKKLFANKPYTSLNIDLNNPHRAPAYAKRLLVVVPHKIINWTNYIGNYLDVLVYTKQMMFLMLGCIIIVAMFNLIATLTTILNEKQSELAILKTLGINNTFVVTLFLSYGFIIATTGLIAGLGIGALLSSNISSISSLLESILGYKFINPQIYFIDNLTAKIVGADILNIIILVYCAMLVSLIYPVMRATKIMPASALRYE